MDLLSLSLTLIFTACASVPPVESLLNVPINMTCRDCVTISSRDQICDFETSIIYQPCRCDSDCVVYGDCCLSTHESCLNSGGQTGTAEYNTTFCCETITREGTSNDLLPGVSDQYWMVSTCSKVWKEKNEHSRDVELVEKNCWNNSIRLPPVTDPVSGLVYKNKYCALCNDVSNIDLTVWDHVFVCHPALRDLLNYTNNILTENDLKDYCTITRFSEPSLPTQTTPARQCYPQVQTCLDLDTLVNMPTLTVTNSWNSSYYNHLKTRCTEGHLQNQVVQEGHSSSIPYRNEYCALCNGVDSTSIQCFLGPMNNHPTIEFITLFSIILDVYGNGKVVDKYTNKITPIHVSCSEDTEVFDPLIEQCRSTIQDCNDMSYIEDGNYNCTQCAGELISLADAEYVFINSTTLLYKEYLYTVEYNTSAGVPVICTNFSIRTINFITLTYPGAFLIITYIGCPLSVVGCVLILLTHALFKELRTLPSQILIQLAITILIGNLLILVSGPIIEGIDGARVLCTPSAILTHYIFLAQFTWMSLMSTEIARNMYKAFRLKAAAESNACKTKLLIMYMLVGWCTPLFIVIITVIVNFTTAHLVLYGELEDGTQGVCWINHRPSIYVSFVTPMAISLIYNTTILFIVTIFLCVSSHSHSKVSRKKKVLYMRLNIAVFSVSGITWAFGFLALLPRLDWAWIPYIIFNSTQGFIIFVAFLCTKRVALLYRSLLFPNKERNSTEGSSKDTLRSAKGSWRSNQQSA